MLNKKFMPLLCASMLCMTALVNAQGDSPNQTQEVSPVLQNQFEAFQLKIEEANFHLPNGLQSYAWAEYRGRWLFICGRTSGMHTFNNGDPNNFPPSAQNSTVYVVNPRSGRVMYRSLTDPSSGLTQAQIDSLSVTAPQSYWEGSTLFVTGGVWSGDCHRTIRYERYVDSDRHSRIDALGDHTDAG